MTAPHPNVALLSRFNPADIAACADIIADDFVWHHFNPELPDLQGDYVGPAGLLQKVTRTLERSVQGEAGRYPHSRRVGHSIGR